MNSLSDMAEASKLNPSILNCRTERTTPVRSVQALAMEKCEVEMMGKWGSGGWGLGVKKMTEQGHLCSSCLVALKTSDTGTPRVRDAFMDVGR
jgi:hypothetical protein